ncbi:ATP-binding protein [Prochlorothrix hollandica]|uniref:ATP-binding protein n=1 Tax=Prochlorothrix hollandica TaxID=1223 RepID=UPI000349FC83|nr:ATP-binding protein [Prochlorothrix hollandica]
MSVLPPEFQPGLTSPGLTPGSQSRVSQEQPARSPRTIADILQREINPFDGRTFKPGNFWHDRPNASLNIVSIHPDIMAAVGQHLDSVRQDGVTRTLLLVGESGAGKSHLLGRLQQQLNPHAFFAYIGPWPDSHYIWRHILRNTVDSLLEIPDTPSAAIPSAEQPSQLMLWIQGLLQLQDRDFSRLIFGQRRIFVRKLMTEYAKGIYNPGEFFGVLYDLTDPDLAYLAASWLRGDNLDQESCEELRVRQPIDSEDAAQKILGNFGKIAAVTQPIVLCFDNLDNLPHLPTGQPDFQSLFNVNSSIHNDKLRNFLLLISVVTNTWKLNEPLVQPADLARIDTTLTLRPIDLSQAQALWANRLAPYHAQAQPRPASPIAPLGLEWLQGAFPSGKALPRNVLVLGQQLIDRLKQTGTLPVPQPPDAGVSQERPPSLQGEFALVWHHELRKTQAKLQRLQQLSSPELVWRLREVLEALEVNPVRLPFLQRTKFAAYSLTYGPGPVVSLGDRSLSLNPESNPKPNPKPVVVLWVEDANLTTFFYVMQACQKTLETQPSSAIYLLRNASLGHGSSKGNQLFHLMFSQANTHHLKPDLESVQMLETYHHLVNAVCGRELVIGNHTPNLPQLQAMVRASGVLKDCSLLQQLGLVSALDSDPMTLGQRDPVGTGGESIANPPIEANSPQPRSNRDDGDRDDGDEDESGFITLALLHQAEIYVGHLLASQKLLGVQALITQAQGQFPLLSRRHVQRFIHNLTKTGQAQYLNPHAPPEAQLVTWVVDRPTPEATP